MAKYVNDKGEEFTSGQLKGGVVLFIFLGVILGGAVAAIPALFGAVVAAAWVWGIFSVFTVAAAVVGHMNARSTMRKVEK